MEQAQEFMKIPKVLSKDDFYINDEVRSPKMSNCGGFSLILSTFSFRPFFERFYVDYIDYAAYCRIFNNVMSKE